MRVTALIERGGFDGIVGEDPDELLRHRRCWVELDDVPLSTERARASEPDAGARRECGDSVRCSLRLHAASGARIAELHEHAAFGGVAGRVAKHRIRFLAVCDGAGECETRHERAENRRAAGHDRLPDGNHP